MRRWWKQITWIPDPDDQEGRTGLVAGLRKTVVVLIMCFLGLSIETQIVLRVQHDQGQQAGHQAYVSCMRSKLIAPYLADAYQRHHVLPPRVLQLYRSTIPKGC